MSRNNSKRIGLLSLSLLLLSSCSTTKIKYPDDYDQALFNKIVSFINENGGTVVQNNKEQYYKTVLTGDSLYKEVVNQLLLATSKKAGENGKNVAQIMFDADQKTGIYGTKDSDIKKADFKNLETRAKESMESNARSGSYSKDGLFKEDKFIRSLDESFSLGTPTAEKKTGNEILITPYMTYDEIYDNNTDFYDYYLHHSLYQDMQINYLTSEYIYQKAYSSIVNSLARRVQVIALTDRSDNGAVGSAGRVLNAYVRDFAKGTFAGQDKDFSILSRVWKGLTVKTIADTDPQFSGNIEFNNSGTEYSFTWKASATDDAKNYLKNLFARYGVTLKDDGKVAFEASSTIIRASEEKWMIDNSLIDDQNSADENCTLAGKVVKDQEKVIEGLNADNLNTVDTALESTYTGSYTYDVGTGFRKAYDDIAITNLVTDGLHTNSGLTSLPDTLKKRIFSTDISTDKTKVSDMQKVENLDKSLDGITTFEKDGFRYVTNPGSLSSENETGNVIYYDSSSKTYYLARVLDVVSATDLNKGVEDSSMYTVAQKELLARQVAYTLSTTGDYKTNAAVYWLRRLKFKYSDEDFLEYMKSNYKDLFKTESTVDEESKFTFTDADFKDILDSLN